MLKADEGCLGRGTVPDHNEPENDWLENKKELLAKILDNSIKFVEE